MTVFGLNEKLQCLHLYAWISAEEIIPSLLHMHTIKKQASQKKAILVDRIKYPYINDIKYELKNSQIIFLSQMKCASTNST